MDSDEDVPLSEFLKKVENDIKRKRNCVHSGEEKRQKLSDMKSVEKQAEVCISCLAISFS